MIGGTFHQLAAALGAETHGTGWIGLTMVATCPACGGRLLAWTRRPGRWPLSSPGYKCADCDRRGDLLGLDVMIWRRSHA